MQTLIDMLDSYKGIKLDKNDVAIIKDSFTDLTDTEMINVKELVNSKLKLKYHKVDELIKL